MCLGMVQRTVLIVIGPTGVGKTDFVDTLAEQFSIEVINGDMGQMYAPFAIGTAKPNWKKALVPHHLFDILSDPIYFSAKKYRDLVMALIQKIWDKNKVPVIVGGSSFYLLSLFFPPLESGGVPPVYPDTDIWKQLYAIDPKRAQQIDPHDTYRIKRALDIWYATGIAPSCYVPEFDPFASCHIVWLSRDRKDLYDRINKRVESMMRAGWIAEVQSLVASEWEPFLRKKKIIGYDLIFDYLAGVFTQKELLERIQKKIRNYAKRQITFWRSFKEKLKKGLDDSKDRVDKTIGIHELNLTHGDIDSYIKQLKNYVSRKSS